MHETDRRTPGSERRRPADLDGERRRQLMAYEPQLVIAFFTSDTQADDAARRLVAWTRSNAAPSLHALGVMAKDEDGILTTRELGPTEARKGAGIGLVAGATAAVATSRLSLLQAVVLGAAGGGALGSLVHKSLQVPAEDLSRIRSKLDPGQAAVGVRVPEWQAATVAEKLAEYGGSRETPDAAPVPEPAAADPVS
jgi:uncharacterized membrane protein